MKVFKYIDVENQQLISDKLYQYVVERTDILNKKWAWNTLDKNDVLAFVPELAESLGKVIDSEITMVSIVYRNPGNAGGIHIDSGRLVRALWPVQNCHGSYTKFFDLNGNSVIETIGAEGDKYLKIGEEFPLKEIAAVELTRPVIFDSGVPHGVYTNPALTGPRLTATMAFRKEPKYFLL